jgi:hypothetical protein
VDVVSVRTAANLTIFQVTTMCQLVSCISDANCRIDRCKIDISSLSYIYPTASVGTAANLAVLQFTTMCQLVSFISDANCRIDVQ